MGPWQKNQQNIGRKQLTFFFLQPSGATNRPGRPADGPFQPVRELAKTAPVTERKTEQTQNPLPARRKRQLFLSKKSLSSESGHFFRPPVGGETLVVKLAPAAPPRSRSAAPRKGLRKGLQVLHGGVQHAIPEETRKSDGDANVPHTLFEPKS